MISTEIPDLELLAEKLLVDAFALRDDPTWESLVGVLESAAKVGAYLKEQKGAYDWVDKHILP